MSATDSTVTAPHSFQASPKTLQVSQLHSPRQNHIYTILLNVVSSNFDDQLGPNTG